MNIKYLFLPFISLIIRPFYLFILVQYLLTFFLVSHFLTLSVNNELERMWKEMTVAWFEILSRLAWGGLRKTRKSLGQNNRSLDRDLITGKKVKFSLCSVKHHAMKSCWGSGGIAPPFLTPAIGGSEWSSSLPRPLYPWERSSRYPLDRRLYGP
jgi:hypothetical protein